MKRKAITMLLSVCMITALSFSAFAAGSTTTSSSSSSSGLRTGGGNPNAYTTTTSTSSSTGQTATSTDDGQSLATNGAGSQDASVTAVFAVGASKTAGLPAAAVAAIESIDSGADLAAAVGDAGLAGYAALTKTAAVVLTDSSTNAVAEKEVLVSLYIPNLIAGLQNVKILYYENTTGLWKVVEPVAIDFESKTVSFNMSGSGTVTVIHNP